MFSKVLLVAISSAALAVATHTVTAHPPHPTPEPVSECNTGDAQCCNNVVSATDPSSTTILHALDVVVEGVGVLVGLGCTPITIIGGTGVCNQQPVCCEDNEFNGLINIGCTSIIL